MQVSQNCIPLLGANFSYFIPSRYSLCRNLLILQQILIEKFDLPCHLLEDVRSSCMPNTVVFVQAYFVMVWICETPIQQMSRGLKGPGNQTTSVLDQFLYDRGLKSGMFSYVEISDKHLTETQWQYTLLPLSLCVGELM